MDYKQGIFIAAETMKDIEKFLKSPFEQIILMHMHLSLMEEAIKLCHEKGRKVFLHLDLIKGLSPDVYGAEYAIQKLRADGIISTKKQVVMRTKELKKTAILRIFLIDTSSLERNLLMVQEVQPDAIELLPGIASSILPRIMAETTTPVMCGGLIQTIDDIRDCFRRGAVAITTSNLKLASLALEQEKTLHEGR